MIRPELHRIKRPFFDATSYQPSAVAEPTARSLPLHLHAEMNRPLPVASLRYSDIKVALRLAA